MIKNSLDKILGIGFNLIPLSVHLKFSGKKLFIPFYHLVSNEEVPHVKHIFSYPSEIQFLEQLDFFGKYFEFIDIQDIKPIHSRKKPSILLTFDDGLRECSEVIAPILKKKGIPAAFFINTDFIDNKDMFYRNKISLLLSELDKKLKEDSHFHIKITEFSKEHGQRQNADLRLELRSMKYHVYPEFLNKVANLLEVGFNTYLSYKKPYMTSEEIKTLIDYGFSVGSHGKNHFHYARLSQEQEISEALESCEILRQKFGIKNITFAFPFNCHSVGKRFFEELHLKNILTTFGSENFLDDEIPSHYHRFWMEDTEKSTSKILKKNFKELFIKVLQNRRTVKR